VLGLAWSLLHPLVLMGVYLLVFSLLWKVAEVGSGDYWLFLLCGLPAWVFFSTAAQGSSRSLLENANLIRKVRFPRQLVPLSVVATHLVGFVVMLVVVVVLSLATIPEARDTVWLAFPLAVLFACIVAGAALAIHWLNFLTPPIEAMRAVLFDGVAPAAGDTIYTAVGALVALAVGAWVFSRSDDRIAVEV
jgi:ABC-type polysaccharide/polyol phosphate export permease